MARLYQHRTDGTYYTKLYLGAGVVTWQIHPDGVGFLKRQRVVPGGDIPPYAMRILHDRSWLFTREEAGQWQEIAWAPAWDALDHAPVGHYPLWLFQQKRDREALLAASRRQAEGEQRAHHREEAAARGSTNVPTVTPHLPRVVAAMPSVSAALAAPHPEQRKPLMVFPIMDRLLWPVIVAAALVVIALLAIAG